MSIIILCYCIINFYSNPVKGSFWLQSFFNVCVLILLCLDEFEASAMPKAKETEAQSEPEDGDEDGREEGKL